MIAKNKRKKLLLAAFYVILRRRLKRKKRKKLRTAWVREIYQQREEKGAYTQIIQELRLSDREHHFR